MFTKILFIAIFQLLIAFLALPTCIAYKGNPFRGRKQYVQHNFKRQVYESLRTSTAKEKKLIKPLLSVSTALWLTNMKSLIPETNDDLRDSFAGALKDASKSGRKAPIVTSVVYNLPNRDCEGGASAGDICCHKGATCDLTKQGKCEYGLVQYRAFIEKIAKISRAFCHRVPMAFIIEPDALPYQVTNTGNPKCGSSSTQAAYKKGIIYAVKKLSKACSRSALYVHAAAGNWLGWRNNAVGFAELIESIGIAPYIHGFALNVAGYQTIGKSCPSIDGICRTVKHPCCRYDPCKLANEYNEGFNEATYVNLMENVFSTVIPDFNPRFVIDTSRAGESITPRTDCGNSCNLRHARVGPRPTSKTGIPSVDAFLWVKPPTESDGCTRVLPNGKLCPTFSSGCESVDSLGGRPTDPRAPEAGQFFNEHFKMMLGAGPTNDSSSSN